MQRSNFKMKKIFKMAAAILTAAMVVTVATDTVKAWDLPVIIEETPNDNAEELARLKAWMDYNVALAWQTYYQTVPGNQPAANGIVMGEAHLNDMYNQAEAGMNAAQANLDAIKQRTWLNYTVRWY